MAIVDGDTVAVRYKNQLALSFFHPEVSEDARVHAYFLNEIVQGYKKGKIGEVNGK